MPVQRLKRRDAVVAGVCSRNCQSNVKVKLLCTFLFYCPLQPGKGQGMTRCGIIYAGSRVAP